MASGKTIPDPLLVAAESSKRLEAAGAFTPLRILQRAVLESGIQQTRDQCGPWQSERDFAKCVFCDEDAQFFDRDTWEQAVARIEHRHDCAYRVAMELPPLSVPVVPRHLRHIEFEAGE